MTNFKCYLQLILALLVTLLCFMSRRILLLIVFFSASVLKLSAQGVLLKNSFIRHIGEKEGLLYRHLDFVKQDKKGFIWVGCNRAMQRFDGKRFKTYFNGTEGTNMSAMGEDNNGILWLSTHAGLYKYNKQKDKFIKYQDSVLVRGKKVVLMCTSIETDYKGNLWFACYNTYAVKFANSDSVVCADSIFKVKQAPFLNFFALQNKRKIWFSGNGDYGIAYYDIEKQKVFNKEYNPENHSLLNTKFKGSLRYAFDSTGGIFVNNSWSGSIIYWQGNDKPIKKLKIKGLVSAERQDVEDEYAPAAKMLVNSKNEVFIQFEEHMGIAKYDRKNESFEYLYASRNTENGLWDNVSPGYGNCEMYLDKDDNIWYPGDGLNILNPNKQIFSNTQGNGYKDWFSASQNSFKGTSIISIVKLTNGNFLASFDGDGIWVLDNNFNLIQNVKMPCLDGPYSYIFSTDANKIFIESNGKLFRYNVETNKCKEVFAKGEMKFSIRKLFVENEQSVWYTHYQSKVAHFNPSTNENVIYPVVEQNSKITLTDFHSIIPDGKVGFWLVASYFGLHLFDTSKKAIVASYYLNPKNITDGTSNVFGAITRYNNDTLIIAGNALVFFDENTHKFTRYKIANGLISDRITSTIVDPYDKNFIWVNTFDKGIFIFNVKTKKVINFASSTGNNMFRGQHFNYINPQTGSMLFSNVNGYSVVNRNGFVNNPTSNKVTIAEILVNNKPVNIDSVTENGKLNLGYQQNNIAIKLASLNYWELTNTNFYVRLNKNEDWQKVDENGEISYLKLPPGKYEFEFAISDNQASRIKASAFLNILLTPPFYQTSWFLLLSIALLLGLVYAWYRRRLKIINDKAVFKQRLAETEMAALKAQMNPHFIFNSLNAINRFILKSEKIEASDYLAKFSKLIRNILENSKLQWISLETEIETLQLYLELEAMRFQQKFNFSIKVSDSVEPSLIQIPPMLIQPFAENAIWHGLLPRKVNCELNIEFNLDEDTLYCNIEDNGIGRTAAAKNKVSNVSNKTSIGIGDTEKRIILLKHKTAAEDVLQIHDLMDNEGNGKGTLVTIKIPYNYI
jgi:ligand-binding sensor domain-containing protein